MAIDPLRVKAIFQSAIERADPDERRAYLDAEVGDDAGLRERLDALIAAHDRPADALDRVFTADPDGATTIGERTNPPGDFAERTENFQPEEAPPAPLIDTVIAGRYKLREEIGEGGMGTVYLAEQTQPVRRKVALKLIKVGMDSRAVLARFESERQALALMEHPHIAKVLDAGTTDAGRPFFVMELVRGIPLTDYCDQQRLGLSDRLTLFRQICSAVQHAHQKGIIHRDLKPTNILVESHDGKPVPKVIDFGLAKAISGEPLIEQSIPTGFGTVNGTPLYMAPEQALFNALDVDTRADIYALGVILYELLTGSTPIRRDTLRRAGLDEMLRVIREVEPPTPSSRISTSEALPNIAANRQTEPARLSRFVRGDLDWIVMKALAKERQRRYASAIAFAEDIERFTNHEPVSAGPPTAGYRLRKFVRRNRGQVVAAALVLFALIGGVVGTTVGLVEARKRLGQKDKANEILLSIFRDLNPRGGDIETLPLSDRLGKRLDMATAALEEEATDDPLGVARMQMALGYSQLGLGYAEKAIILFTKARATFTSRLGPDHADTLTSMDNLASGYHSAGKLDLALPLFEEALERRKARLGFDHVDTLVSMNNLAFGYQDAGKLDLALPLFEEALAMRRAKLGPDDPGTLVSMSNLAAVYQPAGKLDLALPLHEEALTRRKAKLGLGHPDTISSMNNLAEGYRAAGKLDLALPLFEEALALSRSRLGPGHPETLTGMNNLAAGYLSVGKLDLAVPLFEEVLARSKVKLGPGHPDTLASMNNLAYAYRDAGKLDLAVPLFEEVLARSKVKLGTDHADTLASMNNLALGYQSAGQLDRAVPLFEEAMAMRKSRLGPDHPDTITSMHNLASGYQDVGRLDRALPLIKESLKLRKSRLGPDHPDTLTDMNNLASAYQAAGKTDLAVPLFEEALASRKAKLGAGHPHTLMSMNNLASAYQAAGRLDLALPLFEEALAMMKAKLGPDHPSTLMSMNNLAEGYRAAGKLDLALPLYEQSLALMRSKLGPDHPHTLGSMNNLASGYQAAGRLDRALPLFEETLALKKAKLGPDHPDTLISLNNLASGFWSAGRLDRAIPLVEETLKLRAAKSGPDHPETWNVMANLGVNYKDAGRLAEALPLLEATHRASRDHPRLRWVAAQLLDGYTRAGQHEKAVVLAGELLPERRAALTPGSPQLAGLLAQTGSIFLDAKAWDAAEPILRECLAIREKVEPDAWTTFNTKSLLGGALLGQKKHAEAEPLLRAGYEGLKRRADKIPSAVKTRPGEALDRLIALGEATGKADEVRAWREERAKLPASPPRPGADKR